MPDVAIIHAADKGTAATRLAEAIAAAGFAVGAVEIEDPAGLADSVEGCAADARILIWSRALVSHALHSGELFRIRQLPGLIEVSADGITPPSRGDESRVVSISGWRGQVFHPGWQRIHLELKRLCGPRKGPPAASPPPPAAAKNLQPPRAAAAAPGEGVRPRSLRLILGGGAAALLVAAAVGAAGWLGQSRPDATPRQEVREGRGQAAIGGAREPGLGTEPEGPKASVTAAQAPAPSPPPASEPPASASAEPEASPAEPAVRAAPPRPAARPKPRPSTPVGAPKKYSRKHSKVMRQFCERSGRSTPQCRTFLRSIRERGAEAAD